MDGELDGEGEGEGLELECGGGGEVDEGGEEVLEVGLGGGGEGVGAALGDEVVEVVVEGFVLLRGGRREVGID